MCINPEEELPEGGRPAPHGVDSLAQEEPSSRATGLHIRSVHVASRGIAGMLGLALNIK